VTSPLGFVLWIETEVDERIVALAGFHDDIATFAAVAAGGTARGTNFSRRKARQPLRRRRLLTRMVASSMNTAVLVLSSRFSVGDRGRDLSLRSLGSQSLSLDQTCSDLPKR